MSGGLYNMVVRANPAAAILFATVQLEHKLVPRLRDIWINAGLTEVTVFTRTGGGNREAYAAGNAILTGHAGFLRDRDWPTDGTYAEWVFAVPEERAAVIRRDLGLRTAEERARIIRILTADATSKWAEGLSNWDTKAAEREALLKPRGPR